ncbi:MAG: 4Fe-4S binding protein [Lentisphaeria bacterium]|nr:4Fe-4S binding protein [Lentisphaeria bacterium]
MADIKRIKVGTASCGLAAGAGAVLSAFQRLAGDIPVVEVGCIGHCYCEPIVEVELKDGSSVFYSSVKADDASIGDILNLTEKGRFTVPAERAALEKLCVTHLAGRIDPKDLKEYQANGGFSSLKKACEHTPAEVVDMVKKSGLRGRGGAGFSTGMKWSFLAAKTAPEKILIMNADEGDPGAFMDRSMMESVPFQVLEGMLIGAYATGATKLFIYCRAEYPLAIKHLSIAIEAIRKAGLNRLPGREKPLEITIKEGAGAFVCGEETAMIASLEGKRGQPRFRPPFPTDSGWNTFPTAINNVETFANIPVVIADPDAFAALGTPKSTGTKIFALAGDLKNPGLAEVPMGITLGDIVYKIGGAAPGSVKAVQTGGPSGGCIPADKFDVKVDYDSLKELGAIMGSGGLIVIGNDRCMVETARYFLDFTHRESCGKCTFCRVGTMRMWETLERIVAGKGQESDIDFLEDLGNKIRKGSLCALGQTAPGPALSTIRYFRNEYEAHVRDGYCPANQCKALSDVKLDHDKCIKCRLCVKNCPVGAISGDTFEVDNAKCTRCNTCIEMCPKKAIARVKKGEGFNSEKGK